MLDQPLNLPCGAILKNRFAKAAMSEELGDLLGNPSEKHNTLYKRWSNGGAGLLIT
ncbi:MAG: hypothetical protein OEZ34_08785 [Spirochaetia bacterium]|nr:hypothetical protein [Spirochaetia bacterium]